MILPRMMLVVCAALALALGASGCRCPSPGCVPASPVAPCSFECVDPPSGAPDVASLVPACEPSPCDFPCLLPGPAECYESLSHSQCQCHAATNATVANAVEVERHWANTLICCEEGAVEEALCLTRSLLALQAADLRNAASASALTSFYLLAGLEAKQDYLDRGIAELAATVRRLEQLDAQGLPRPKEVDRDALATRLAGLHDQRLQLCYLRIQLNGQLKRLVGCPLDAERFFWPQVSWAPDLTPLDVDAEVAEGLVHRADVRSLRLTRCKLDKATVPVSRMVLKVADATLGSVTPAQGLVHHLRCGDCKDHEIAVRCRQLTMLEVDATRLAEAKIKSGAYKVAVQQDRVRLAKQSVDERRRELRRIETQRDAGEASVFELSAARGRVFDAEASLVEKVAELKIARVGLREVQGMLALECGYDVAICGENCCTGKCVCAGGGCSGGCGAELECCEIVGCGE